MSEDWTPLDDDEADAQEAAQAELAELAEWWENETEATAALYGARRRKLSDYLLTARELDKIPPVVWLIDGVLPMDAIAVMYAEPGAGKTFVALDWCAHLATGREAWEGRPLRADTRALYVYAEGAPGLRKRRDAWEVNHDMRIEGNLWFIIRAANFLSNGAPESVEDWPEMCRIVETLQPHLIVVDTLSRSIPGADENDQSVMSGLLARVDQLRELSDGATILFLHHTNAAGTRERGSSVVKGAANTMINLSDGVLRVTKQRDDQEPVLGRVELVDVEGTGSVVPTYVAIEDDGPDNETVRRRQVLEAVAGQPGISLSQLHESIGGGKGVLSKVVKALEDQGAVRVERSGRVSKHYPVST